jgi:copper chaperone CopZ
LQEILFSYNVFDRSNVRSRVMKAQRMTLPIYDLSCGGGGVLIVQQALARTVGVEYVYVNPATEMAYVEYDPAQADPTRLIQAVEHAGFRAGAPSLR